MSRGKEALSTDGRPDCYLTPCGGPLKQPRRPRPARTHTGGLVGGATHASDAATSRPTRATSPPKMAACARQLALTWARPSGFVRLGQRQRGGLLAFVGARSNTLVRRSDLMRSALPQRWRPIVFFFFVPSHVIVSSSRFQRR